MSAFTGEHSSGPVSRESSCHRRTSRPQSNDETVEKFAKLHDAEAEESAVIAELKTHTNKYSEVDVKQALERSQEGIS